MALYKINLLFLTVFCLHQTLETEALARHSEFPMPPSFPNPVCNLCKPCNVKKCAAQTTATCKKNCCKAKFYIGSTLINCGCKPGVKIVACAKGNNPCDSAKCYGKTATCRPSHCGSCHAVFYSGPTTVVKCPDYCKLPIAPANGRVKSKGKYTDPLVGEQVEYSCLTGYQRVGSQRRTCHSNGKLSGSAPLCKKNPNVDKPDPDQFIPETCPSLCLVDDPCKGATCPGQAKIYGENSLRCERRSDCDCRPSFYVMSSRGKKTFSDYQCFQPVICENSKKCSGCDLKGCSSDMKCILDCNCHSNYFYKGKSLTRYYGSGSPCSNSDEFPEDPEQPPSGPSRCPLLSPPCGAFDKDRCGTSTTPTCPSSKTCCGNSGCRMCR